MPFPGADDPAARCVLDGPISADVLHASVERVIAQTPRPGDIAIVDEFGRNQDARLSFLPPVSSDADPIEQPISNIEQSIRTACDSLTEAVPRLCAAVIASLPPGECTNEIARSGEVPVRTRSALIVLFPPDRNP